MNCKGYLPDKKACKNKAKEVEFEIILDGNKKIIKSSLCGVHLTVIKLSAELQKIKLEIKSLKILSAKLRNIEN